MAGTRSHGPWRIHQTGFVYQDSFIKVTLDQVTRPDGHAGQHVVAQIRPGVCVLAIDDQGLVYLTKEFHYAIGRDSIEAVSGGIEDNEEGLACAHRELQEELGLQANRWAHLTTIDPFTTIVSSPTQLYLAQGLTQASRSPEGTELIETVVMPLREAIAMVKTGKITHAPTCVLLLLAHEPLDREIGQREKLKQ
jgi:ADP-ribose pyrophosphatase